MQHQNNTHLCNNYIFDLKECALDATLACVHLQISMNTVPLFLAVASSSVEAFNVGVGGPSLSRRTSQLKNAVALAPASSSITKSSQLKVCRSTFIYLGNLIFIFYLICQTLCLHIENSSSEILTHSNTLACTLCSHHEHRHLSRRAPLCNERAKSTKLSLSSL